MTTTTPTISRGRCAALCAAVLLSAAACGRDPAVQAPPAAAGPTPSAPAAAAAGDRPFADVTDAAGLRFRHDNGMTDQRYFVEMMGAGGALFDYDGDGDLDLYAVNGHRLDPAQPPPAAGEGPPAGWPVDQLFRNDLAAGSDGQPAPAFADVTAESGIRAGGYGMGAWPGDYDNDGDVDLYITNWGPNQLWRNNGDGTFADATAASGTGDPGWSTGASWFDFDRDGWLDLFVVNYDAYSLEGDHPCFSAGSGRRDYCGPEAYADEPDRLYRNKGDGTFEDVTLPMGVAAGDGSGLGVVTADFNGDGWADIFVANDADPNQLWINMAGRRFEDQAPISGTAVSDAGIPKGNMGVTATDFDGDGDEDLFIAELQGEQNTLYVNDGQGLFEDRSQASGLGAPALPFTGFGAADVDYDNDGRPDMFVANGEVRIIEDQAAAGEALPLRQANQLYRNDGGGRFTVVAEDASGVADAVEVGRGAALGDIDNDGDSDIAVFNNNGPARLLLNRVGQDAPWVGFRAVGTVGVGAAGGVESGTIPNDAGADAAQRRDMLGARVSLLQGGRPIASRRVRTDGSYLAGNDPRVLFGLGSLPAFDGVRVDWPDGSTETWAGLAAGQYHTLVQGEGSGIVAP